MFADSSAATSPPAPRAAWKVWFAAALGIAGLGCNPGAGSGPGVTAPDPLRRVACVAPAETPSQAGSWPGRGGGLGGQYRSRAVGPTLPAARWVYEFDFPETNGIALGPRETLYLARRDGIYALGSQGELRWFRRASPVPWTTPAVDAEARSYLQLSSLGPRTPEGRAVALSALDACGQLRWQFLAESGNGKGSLLGPEGTSYLLARVPDADAPEALYALDGAGKVRWSKPTPAGDTWSTVPVMDAQGTLYLGSIGGKVYAVSGAGALLWVASVVQAKDTRPGAHQDWVFQVASSQQGTVLAATGRSVTALDAKGAVVWRHELKTGNQRSWLSVGDDGSAIVASGRTVLSLASDGAERWRYERAGTAGQPLVDGAGVVYVPFSGSDYSELVALDATGHERWTYYTGVITDMALGSDGTLYVAAGDRLYALGNCTQPPCSDDGEAEPALNHPPVAPAPPAPRATPALPPRVEHHAGFDVYPGCRPASVAIVSREGEDFPWYGSGTGPDTAKRRVVREDFRRRALSAIRLSHHASGFGASCVEPRGAFVVYALPGQDVDDQARAIGQWLVQERLRGEILVVESEMPQPHAL